MNGGGVLLFIMLMITSTQSAPFSQCAPKCQCYNKEMKCIDEELTVVPQWDMGTFVELLDLSFNNIKVLLNDSFQDFPKIKDIFMSSAHITLVDTLTFHGLLMLEKVDLSYNYIDYIDPNIFESNKNLQTVILNHNVFHALHEPFLISYSVKHLDLSHCMVTHLTDNVLSGLSSLQTLDLSYNSLSYLSPDTFALLTDLSFTDVSNNDWKCDHNFDTLMCWVHQHTTQHDKLATTFCYDKKGNKQTWTVKSCQHPNTNTDYSTMVQYSTTQFEQQNTTDIVRTKPQFEQQNTTDIVQTRSQFEQHNTTDIVPPTKPQLEQQNNTNIVPTKPQFQQHNTTNIVPTKPQFQQHNTTNIVPTTPQFEQHNTTNIVPTTPQFEQHNTTNIVPTTPQFEQHNTTNIVPTTPQFEQHNTTHIVLHNEQKNNLIGLLSLPFSMFIIILLAYIVYWYIKIKNMKTQITNPFTMT